MIFNYRISEREDGMELADYLKKQLYSNKLIKKLKQEELAVLRNRKAIKMYQPVWAGDYLEVHMPAEAAHPHIQAVYGPLDILFEDEHLLVINKEAGLLSNPSFNCPTESVSNRVLNYYIQQSYPNLVIHLVTRLDRDTSGILIFAKHKYAHALMDRLLRRKQLYRYYLAASPKSTAILSDHGWIDLPIGRSEKSIIERQVKKGGKPSLTEYWRVKETDSADLFKIQLHTGRTHQIRVHFSHLGLSLLGDDLYGQHSHPAFNRQALHCYYTYFIHPLSQEEIKIKAPLPADFKVLLDEY